MLSFQEIVDKIDQLEEANILVAALQFRIYTQLGKGSMSAATLARRTKTDPDATARLLNALAAMGALKKKGNAFANTSETYKHFSEDSPHYKRGTVMLREDNRREWNGLIELTKKGRKQKDFEGGDDPLFRREFTHAMHERSRLYAPDLVEFVTRKPVGRLLDLGGGPGSYTAALLKKDKAASAVLVDRKATLKQAKLILQSLKVLKRIELLEGDLFEIDFKQCFDSVLFANILHIFSPAENKKLLRKIHESLKPGGRLLIVDLFLKDNQIEPLEAALFSLTMLMATATGKSYSFTETETLLRSIGFGAFKRANLGRGCSVIEAVKKAG
ncbi:MAG: methyltransferase domain-containing protein [Candidatus Nitrohelix vancouverensis]|uniref:Methyltransferase domain-containing protein n=1 Tax=Candidatus Nitrohelix vancouverensis TaxID=2705534 RepID=A0A7T0C3T9_9BACT|nr:MAG: methyltransferase domain-containing protein [Candidatus Nitrohelix vancouverensis]